MSKISPASKIRIFNATKGHCWYCGTPLALPEPDESRFGLYSNKGNTFVVDHIHPRHHGGGNDSDNLVAACHSCNSSKRTKSLEEFREWQIKKLGAIFNEDQIAFWKARGVKLPTVPREEYPVFYGETL